MKIYAFNQGMLRLWLPPKILLIMKLVIIILTTCLLQVSAASFGQKVTLSEKDVPLELVLKKIRQQTGYDILYRDKVMSDAKKVTINITDSPLEDALDKILKNQNLTYTITDKTIVINEKAPTFLERLAERWAAIDVHGRVVDQEGKPLPGASVKIKSTGKTVSTDANGRFQLNGVDEGAVLVVSFIGYVTKEVGASKDMENIVLELSDSKLDEIQVTAYGKTTQRLSTGNISTVKAEDIAKAPVANPLLAIAGRVPGVFIQQSSGVPGTGVKIVIQGQNSFNYGNDPFYVIDGVPYTSQLLPGLGGGILGDSGSGTPGNRQSVTAGNPLNFINPQDIESIDVLKDADATSIYGSRAAHGAIIITTKKGKIGKTAVNFNVQQGRGRITRRAPLLNTEQYLTIRKEAYINSNTPIPTNPAEFNTGNYDLTVWDQKKYTDWQKKLVGGMANYTNLQSFISGGTINTQYLLSGAYQSEGTVTASDLKDQKASIHFNLNSSSENKKFKLSFTGSYLSDNNKLAAVQDVASAAFSLPPNAPDLYNADGTLNWELRPSGLSSWNNPMASLKRAYINKTKNLVSNLQLSYQLVQGLEIKSSFGYNNLESEEIQTQPSSSLQPFVRQIVKKNASFSNAKINTWIIEPQLTYVKQIGLGKIDFLLGTTITQEDRDRLRLDATGFISDESILNIKAASNVMVHNSTDAVILSTYKYNALFSRLNYNWDDKYILSASIRRDGSSRFGKENRFHNFGSIAGAWLFSNEQIVKNNLGFLSFGKMRASYGTSGNDQIGDYRYLNLYGSTETLGSSYQGLVGLEPFSGFPNPYLQWEETRKFSTTIDFGFFNDRVLLSATYYKNKSSNQLASVNLPSITGGSSVTQNNPLVVQNTGLEVSLSTINFSSKSFRWNSSFNLTIPRNKLLKYDDLDVASKQDLVGRPLGITKVYHYLGVDPTSGLYLVADRNGNPTTTPDYDLDRTVYVDLSPQFYGGLHNSFSYKNLSLDVLFQFVKQMANNVQVFGNNPGGVPFNQWELVLDRWQKPGDQSSIQKFTTDFSTNGTSYNASQSDKAISDASYVRLKNISINYQLPERWMNKAQVHNMKIFVQGQNLLTFTKYKGIDPESKNYTGVPVLKILTVGLSLGL